MGWGGEEQIRTEDINQFIWYNKTMSTKPLIETNPYLRDPSQRKKLLYSTAVSSTAIEGVHVAVAKEIKAIKESQELIISDESEESGESQK